MNEKGTHNLGTVDMTLRYHFETGRGGSQSGQSNNRDSEGRLDYRVADTLGGQSPVDGEALGRPWAGSDHAISVFLGQGPDKGYSAGHTLYSKYSVLSLRPP